MSRFPRLLLLFAAGCLAGVPRAFGQEGARAPGLLVTRNGRYFISARGKTAFLLGDTAWGMARNLKRDEVTEYLRVRSEQGFNAVTFVLVGSNPDIAEGPANAFGD